MSLVAYGSSDENSDEEENNSGTGDKNKVLAEIVTTQKTTDKLCLPVPKHSEKVDENNVNTGSLEKIHFDKLPKPKSIISETEDIIEEDDIPLKKEIELKPEKPMKRDRVPVKITVPSLSDFQDVDEENETKSNRIKPSNKGTKLFALLPPPKGAEVKNTNKLVPTTVSKTAAKISQEKVQTNKKIKDDSHTNKVSKTTATTTTRVSMDISSDEDEDDAVVNSKSSTVTDFFALSATEIVSNPDVSESFESIADLKPESSKIDSEMKQDSEEACSQDDQKTLASVEYDILSLPREEILLKNKAEVGPKLPVPEQEYNIDTEGNVAFDDKAIEYLCGRRGVKRKPKEIKDVNIIEINGEDIKPDEREWLVKALTEEPVQRPVSMQGGVNSQSKKKHQITYLAHQAKAMEMELKNQWAQNRLTRKQTQSKYGF